MEHFDLPVPDIVLSAPSIALLLAADGVWWRDIWCTNLATQDQKIHAPLLFTKHLDKVDNNDILNLCGQWAELLVVANCH